MNKVYEIITDRIIKLLEQGTIPWHQPWHDKTAPKNLVSKKEYHGINRFLLGNAAYTSPYWLTYNQAKGLGGQVKKGEHGYPVVFWKFLDQETTKDAVISGLDVTLIKVKKIPLLRYYTVFNTEQCDGITVPAPVEEKPFIPIEKAAEIVANMPNRPTIEHREDRAYYKPSLDLVNMPVPESFEIPEEYYSTLFHELGHSTGHPSRLDRREKELAAFGSATYSKEELIAEMAAAFLCETAHISAAVIDNSAAYIQNWLKVLRGDNRIIVTAAGQAQKAADYILGINAE